jgi:uroporphyrinogen-III synthase
MTAAGKSGTNTGPTGGTPAAARVAASVTDDAPARRPLAGRAVVVTRDGDPHDPLAAALAELGARVCAWPTLAFEPPADPTPLRAALAAAFDPDPADPWHWIVFTSPRAVDAVVAQVEVKPPAPRVDRPRIAAVGAATARALDAAGWHVDLVGEGAGAEALARTMAASGPLADARILFPASSLAREALNDGLEALGARVVRVEAYRTVADGPDAARVGADLEAGLDALTFASPSAVAAVADCLAALGSSALRELPCAAIGPTTAAALRHRGARHVTVAARTDLESLARATVHALGGSPSPNGADR